MSYPIDIESVKSTKLFKKFMESKNKSVSISGPRIQNVDINVKPQVQPLKANQISKPSFGYDMSSPKMSQEPDSFIMIKPSFPREELTMKRNFQSNAIEEPRNLSTNYNYESSQRKTENPVKQKIMAKDQTDYQKKYDRLNEEYNELKQKVSQQRKETRKQMIKLEEQVDMLTKKIFELRNREDELILENKRLKQKSISEGKEKLQIEQANRQLSFQIQQLRDMVDGQQNSSKKKEDETLHWRKINDDLKQRVRELELEIVKLKDLNNMNEREKYVIQKEVSNKQCHLNEMRQKINNLITENGVLRDQMFHITGKLYHFEQENKSLKADLRRHSDDFPMAYLQQQLQQARYSRPPQSPPQNKGNMMEGNRVEGGVEQSQKRTQRRRGEFARERGLKKAETQSNDQRPPPQQPPAQQPNKDIGQAIRKLEQLNEQLQKLKDSKAMNGTMRRQKITLERQILEIEQFLKGQQ